MYVEFFTVYYVLVYHIKSYYKMYFNVNNLMLNKMKGTKKVDEQDGLYIYHKGLVKELWNTRNLRGNRACCNMNGGSLLLFYESYII